jgi:DNA (cytosine-5)-methyltransferase 1
MFHYDWKLSDGYPADGVALHGRKVFGTFVCGGGSSMGYKLAGYHHLGGVEIDPQIAEVYKMNHNPKHLYIESVRDFNDRQDLPEELYNLDLLDGSPPCSSFSTAGKRDSHWGKSKIFAEGQAKQRLDDLVFVYVQTILKLRPKTFVLENVQGLIQGRAKAYTREICQTLINGGYTAQVFALNSQTMGVPQSRPRVFIVGHQNKLQLKKLKLCFNEKVIPFKEVSDPPGINRALIDAVSPLYAEYWKAAEQGGVVGKFKSVRKIKANKACVTVTATKRHWHPLEMRELSDSEILKISSFPSDYRFNGKSKTFMCGMSVPPVMTAHVALKIYEQWLKHLPATPRCRTFAEVSQTRLANTEES